MFLFGQSKFFTGGLVCALRSWNAGHVYRFALDDASSGLKKAEKTMMISGQ